MIFVFGSNLAGRHGRGAAKHALENYGAKYGQGEGRQGDSYAIPTKDVLLQPLPINFIRGKVNRFLQYARENEQLSFLVTRIGCGLAGFTDEQIAPMFKDAPKNCHLPAEWWEIYEKEIK